MKKRIFITFAIALCVNYVEAGDNPYRLEKLLAMDDVTSPNAITPLEETLRMGGKSIRPCAAAQALFLMNKEETKEILKKWLWYPHYDLDYSIRLAFHWGMEPHKRDEFIKKYHLNSRSKDVGISIKAIPAKNKKNEIEITIFLTNSTDSPLRLYKPRIYVGRLILLVSENGEVMEPVTKIKYSVRRSSSEELCPEIAPGKSLVITFIAKPETSPDSASAEFRGHLWFDCGDFSHKLTTTGKFKIYARYEHRGSRNPSFDNIWTGRVVSEPVEIEISE